MHGSKKRLTAIAAVSIAALALSACADSEREPTTEGGGGGTFVFGAAADPGTLDPAFATDGETFRVTRQIFEGLLEPGEGTAEPQPGLADSYEPSDDGLTYTFQLKEGVTFHDGADFNADAVCFNFDRWYNFEGLAQSPAASGYWQDVFGGFASTPEVPSIFKSCSADDEFTAVIDLTRVTS
ncbi:MAG: ABC transporter substrate-binding protein, partial [Geodermatophilaceae bacterium]|nr:ABC transporter substrate-binding protein [Geodermatophilaceae bacterium]